MDIVEIIGIERLCSYKLHRKPESKVPCATKESGRAIYEA